VVVTTFAPNLTTEQGGKGRSQFVPVWRHYRVESVATPHSKQRLFSDVINPQAGHILCDRPLALCGISLRIDRSSRIVKITITSPKTILVAFIRATLLGEFCLHQASQPRWLWTKWSNPSLAEKPKVGELQMDWLRSEDLNEEKNVTASTTIIAAPPLWRRQEAGRPSIGT
jgi:hypothetical protein